MTRNNGIGSLVAVLALLGTVTLAACNPIPAHPKPVDVTTVTACPTEDGPGMTGPAPCVFDGGPDVASSAYGTRWVYYAVDDTCSLDFVQDHRLIHCVTRSDWTGGTGSGEGRTN